MNNLPWGMTSFLDILDAYSISYMVYNSGQMGAVDLSPYDKVMILGQQDDNFYWTLDANRAWFEAYMAAGGWMQMTCAAYFGYANELITWPGGWGHSNLGGVNSVTMVQPGHPVFNNPMIVNPGDLQGWNYSSHGTLDDLPDNTVVLIENAEIAPGTPCTAEFCWGAGGGFATAQPMSWMGSAHPYLINVALYMGEASPTATESATWGQIKSLYE
jgi:hypothetical protein